MRHINNKINPKPGITILLVAMLLIVATACEPYQTITFENDTSYQIQPDVYRVPLDYSGTPKPTWDDNYKEGKIDIGQSKKLVTQVPDGRAVTMKFAVIAVNSNNDIVYSKVFTWDELHDMGWKVVINEPK